MCHMACKAMWAQGKEKKRKVLGTGMCYLDSSPEMCDLCSLVLGVLAQTTLSYSPI